MTHTDAFAQHVSRRQAERDAECRVTWRRVSADTGGGWSGLGPNGLLVYVGPASKGELRLYEYGRREGDRKVAGGSRTTLADAKRAAELLMRRMAGKAPYQAGNDKAAEAAEGSTMTTEAPTTTTALTAEELMEGIGEAVAAQSAAYHRLRVDGKTLAYADHRKSGFVVSFATGDVEKAPSRFQKVMENRGDRTVMKVTAKNVKTARALLEWVAKQKQAA